MVPNPEGVIYSLYHPFGILILLVLNFYNNISLSGLLDSVVGVGVQRRRSGFYGLCYCESGVLCVIRYANIGEKYSAIVGYSLVFHLNVLTQLPQLQD